MASTAQDQTYVSEVALANPIVLHQIFIHLPSEFLISSCSLVNKAWHRITRTVLRDHGKCLAHISSCHCRQDIQELGQFCLYLEQEGRVVPFNGLKIYNCVPFHPDWHPLDPESLAVYRSITCLMQLKHLEVGQAEIAQLCPLQCTLIAWLLSGNCSHLQSLNIENPLFIAELFYSNPALVFPQLEIITIPDLLCDPQTDRIQQMLAAAPNLKRIVVQDVNMLNYLPPDKYSLLFKIHFHVKTAEQETLFRKVVEAKPKLAELLIIPPSAAVYDWERNDDEDSVDPAVQQRSDKMLERLFQTCHTTLEAIRVIGLLNPLSGLSFPPLGSLIKITMHKWAWSSTGNEKFWRDISSIDYRRRMPALEEIVIEDTTRCPPLPGSIHCDVKTEKMIEWPTSCTGPLVRPQCSSNAPKLTLNLLNKEINLIPIKSMAPNLTMLELKIRHTSEFNIDMVPFSDIWKFWPQLVELRVSLGVAMPNRNYDPDFCGIFEEEAEDLRDKDVKYLRNLCTVPVRPSILSMTRLRRLDFELDFWGWDHSVIDGPPAFLSHVTQMLAFRRMQHTVITSAGIPML